MSKKQVTFADIAEYTNFSKTTISNYKVTGYVTGFP